VWLLAATYARAQEQPKKPTELQRAIDEFKIQTTNLGLRGDSAAKNARKQNPILEWHGRLYENLRNDFLDAVPHEIRQRGENKSLLRRNQYGFNAAGPFFVPGLVHKNGTYLSLSFEGVRERISRTHLSTIPTMAERTGDYSHVVDDAGNQLPVFDPATTRANPAFNSAQPASPANAQYLRDPFPGNVIPARRIDPIAGGILNYVDHPNLGTLPLGLARFLNNDSFLQDGDQFSIRVDHVISSRDQLFGRYSYSNESLFAPGGLTTQGTRREPKPQIFTLGETRTLSPTATNEARLGFTRLRLFIVNKNAYTENIPAKLGINGQEGLPPSAWEVPNITFSNDGISSFGGANFGVPTVTRDNTYQFQDTLVWSKSSHTLRAGFQYAHFQLNNATLNYILPSYLYRATPLTADVANPVGLSRGSEFADFLLGFSHNNQVTAGSGQVYLRRNVVAPWFEDAWRVTRNLTVTLGLRWDYISPLTEKYDHIASVYVPNLNGPLKPIPIQANVNVPNYGQVPRGLVATNLNDWAPRVGLAYRLGGSDKTVLPAAYGMFYDAQIGNTVVDLVRNPPFQTRIIADMPDSIFPTLTLKDLQPQGAAISSSYFAMGQAKDGKVTFPTPYVQQWNFSAQREVMPNWAVTGSYVGSTGRHLSFSGIANIPYPGPTALNIRRPFNPDVTVIFQYAQPRVNSYYHAMQLKSEHRNFHGLTMLNAYTWSKSKLRCSLFSCIAW